jgi:hypothetical protein
VSEPTSRLLAVDVREEPSVDDLDRARLQDFYDELERFRSVFGKAQTLVAPMIGEDASRLEAMGKAIRKLYGGAVEPLMAHVDQVLAQARRMTDPLPENPLHRAFERRAGGDRRRGDRAVIGPSFRAPQAPAVTVPAASPAASAPIPLPAPERRASDGELPTIRTRALKPRAIPTAPPPRTTSMNGHTRNGHGISLYASEGDGAASEGDSFVPPTRPAPPRATSSAEPRPPRPPSISPTSVATVRREPIRPPDPDLRITYEDPGGWGVL